MSMQEYLGPGQMMSQQLQGIVQNAAQTAVDKRTMLAMRQQQRIEMQQDMENNLNLSKALLPYDKKGAWEAFNRGLRHINREVSFENFDIASGLFEQAADYKSKQDFQGMATVLKGADQYLVNLSDRQRAQVMQREAQKGMAGQQADVMTEAEGKPPALDRAERILGITQQHPPDSINQRVMLAPGVQEQLVNLVGSDNPEDIRRAVVESEAIVNGYESKRKLRSRMLEMDPKAYDQWAQTTGAALGNPKLMADARIAELLQKPDRTEQEDAELSAKIDVYAPDSLRTLYNEKSAANAKLKLLAQLEDVGNRLVALDGNMGGYNEANMTASQIDAAHKALPGDGTMTDAQAKDVVILHGTRAAKLELWNGRNGQKVSELEQTAAQAEQQVTELSRRAVTALPAQRDLIDDRIKEFKHMAKANKAQARLLGPENPWTISQREANLPLLPEYDQEDERKALDELKAQRDADIKTVEDEKARLMRREAILRTQLPQKEKDEEKERRMRGAQQSVAEARSRGMSMTQAVRDASKYFDVSAGDLNKHMKDFYGSGIYDAQLDFSNQVIQWSKAHGGQMPGQTELIRIKRDVMKKWNVTEQDLGDLDKDQNKAIKLEMIDPTTQRLMTDARGRLIQIANVRSHFKSKYVGKLDDLFARWASPVGGLSKEENQFRAETKKLVAELKRFYIGAAQTKPELAGLMPVLPETFNSENEFIAALDAAEEFAKIYLGEAVAVAGELGQKAPSASPSLSPQQKQMFNELKKSNPNVEDSVIEEFIRGRR